MKAPKTYDPQTYERIIKELKSRIVDLEKAETLPKTPSIEIEALGNMADGDMAAHIDESTGVGMVVYRQDGKIYKIGASEVAASSGGASGGTTDHGLLTGLGDDDHTIYLLISGTRAMTGALTLSGLPTADLHAAGKGYIDQSIKRGAILFG